VVSHITLPTPRAESTHTGAADHAVRHGEWTHDRSHK
jgi:hypothetical protein